jgi:hypothetical protein
MVVTFLLHRVDDRYYLYILLIFEWFSYIYSYNLHFVI